MRFGIQISPTYPANLDSVDVCQNMCERAQMAYEHNFEVLFSPQHYVTGPSTAVMQSLPLLGYLAGQAPGMYIGTAIFMWFRLEPGMNHQAALDTIQAFGEEVIRVIKRATPSCPVS